MIASAFAGSQSERRLLPGGSLRSPTPYVIAIMTFVMMVVAAAGLTLANAAGLVAGAVEQRYVVQLPDSSRTAAVVEAVRSVDGVASVTPVSEQEMRETLERWLGPVGAGSGLPVPALIHVELIRGTDSAPVAEAVARADPRARLVSERATVGPLIGSIRALQWLALALVLLMAAAASAAVVLATRGALETHRSTIEIMHGIGATDEQIARLFQRKIALDAGTGAVAGALLAAIALIAIAGGGASIAGATGGRPALGGWDLLAIALVPLAATLLSTLVARMAVLGALRNS